MRNIKKIDISKDFDKLYLYYNLETSGIIVSAGSSKLFNYSKYLLYLNEKVIGFYFGKYEIVNSKLVFIILQFYILPKYRIHYKYFIDLLYSKYDYIVTNVRNSLLNTFEKHNIGERIS